MEVLNDYEAREAYEAARRMGRREMSRLMGIGESGLLPCLDDLPECDRTAAEITLPISEIPLSKVVGTSGFGRTYSFAANFMPISETSSEFAHKWISLCRHHLTEGIHDPILCVEYLGKYYVTEGNKRVSVLKYFGAYSVTAKVTRILPHPNSEDPTITQYYEHLEYDKTAPFGNVEAELPRTCIRLLRLAGDRKDTEKLTDIYRDFASVFTEICPTDLHLAPGDAFAEYSRFCGLPEDVPSEELKQRITDFIPQFRLRAQGTSNDITLLESEPDTESSPLSRLLRSRRRIRAGFAYTGRPNAINWSRMHDVGRLQAQEDFANRLETFTAEGLLEEDDPGAGLHELAAKGLDVLFVTSQVLADEALKIALAYPKTVVFLCSHRQIHRQLNTYFGRYYEPVFLCGLIAGMLTDADRIGYVLPRAGLERCTADVNAFALGVGMVNPRAKVYSYGTPAGDVVCENLAAAKTLAGIGCDLIMANDSILPDADSRPAVFSSLMRISRDGTPERFVAAPLWDWTLFYRHILEGMLEGSLDILGEMYPQDARRVSYWWGMRDGLLNIEYGPEITPAMRRVLDYMRPGVEGHVFRPFSGPLYDNAGTLRVEEDRVLTGEEILEMTWPAENIVILPGRDRTTVNN